MFKWEVFFSAACIVLLITICLQFAKLAKRNRGLFAAAGLLLAVYFLYLPFFLGDLDLTSSIGFSVLKTIQTVVLENDITGYFTLLEDLGLPHDFIVMYILLFSLLHIIIPISIVTTVIQTLRVHLTAIKFRLFNHWAKRVIIFSEINEKTEAIARDIVSSQFRKRTLLLFADAENDAKDISPFFHKSVFRRTRILIREIATFDLQIHYETLDECVFFHFSDDHDRNLIDTLSLIDVLSAESVENREKCVIYCRSSSTEARFILDSKKKDYIDVRLFNGAKTGGYNLLFEHPLFDVLESGKKTLGILILGSGRWATEIFRAALWCGQLGDIALTVRLIDTAATRIKKEMMLQYPELFGGNYSIDFIDADVRGAELTAALEQYCKDTDYAVCCLDNDEDNIRVSIFLRRFFMKDRLFAPHAPELPLIAAQITNPEKTEVVLNLFSRDDFPGAPDKKVSFNIVPFGSINSLYTYRNIANNFIDEIALNVHRSYLDNEGEEIDALTVRKTFNKSCWDKESNRANALHIKYKLWVMGLSLCEDPVETISLDTYLSPDLLDKLARIEHDRWNTYHRTEGWTEASPEDLEKFKEKGISARQRSSLLQMHLFLCAYEDLPEKASTCGLKDPTRYDIDFIRNIPKIIGDHWHLTGKKYYITKR